jgi:colanic acid biosynthesis glycosyl transferase WcaI
VPAIAQIPDAVANVDFAAGPGRSILILNQTFYPDVVSTAQHATDLAVALVGAGYRVTILTGAHAYDDPSTEFPARESWRGMQIIRVSGTAFGKGARWRRAADFGTYMAACAARAALLQHHDLTIALTSPPLISFLGSLLVPLKKTGALLFWAMDLNPDEAIAAGWLREQSLPVRVLSSMQLQSMRRATRIVALDGFMKERMVAKGLAADKIDVISPWTHEPVSFDSTASGEFRAQHGLAGKFVVMYSGNHSPCHPLDTVIQAARRLESDPRIVFCFVGGGSEYRRLREIARQQNLRNLMFLPYQPLERLGASLSAADLHLVVMGEPFVGIIHPCKIYNVLRVGAPVLYIGPSPSHITDLLAELNSSQTYRANNGDVEGVLEKILAAAAVPHRANPRHVSFAEKFSHQILVSRMLDVVQATLVTSQTRP